MILDLIEEDLRRAWLLNIEDDVVFVGEPRTMLGESADSMVFLTSVDSTQTFRVDDREIPADIAETGYRLRANPEVPDVLELWRRQSLHIDEEPLEEGIYERLHDRVVSFEIRYWADMEETTDPVDSWDVQKSRAMPAMISITMGLEVGPRRADDRGRGRGRSGMLWYRRYIELAPRASLALRVHPLPPTFAGPATAGGVATGGQGEGEGEGAGEGESEIGEGTPTGETPPGGETLPGRDRRSARDACRPAVCRVRPGAR